MSTAFSHEGTIPTMYTCEGQDASPPLAWTGLPVGTKSLALIVDDPDAPDPAAPKMTWVHWVLYNLPPTIESLPEGMKTLPQGTKNGINDGNGRAMEGHALPSADIAISTNSMRSTSSFPN